MKDDKFSVHSQGTGAREYGEELGSDAMIYSEGFCYVNVER